jgi:DNA-binding transcriptional ArsR family regulator
MTDNGVFEALSHPARRRILALLNQGRMSAGSLAEHFEFSKPTLSVHLKKLKAANLVSLEREGTSLIYSPNLSVLEEALSGLLTLKDRRK